MNLFHAPDPRLCQAREQAGWEISPPMSAQDFLKSLYIPRYRPGVSSLKVLEAQNLPDLAQRNLELVRAQMDLFSRISPFAFPFEIKIDAARIKIAYVRSGNKYLEDLTVSITYMVAYHRTPYGTMGATTWTPVVTCFRAPANEMEKRIRTFRIIHDSRKDNPRWAEDYVRLCATVARDQIARKQEILRSMEKITRTQSEIEGMIADAYYKRNAAYDRIFDSYSEAVRGVESYKDPINDGVELPRLRTNAWPRERVHLQLRGGLRSQMARTEWTR